jgi:GNAT superfamily N-acetyltransferase
LDNWPLFGWLAQIKAEPVGFVLLQPDLTVRMRRAGGGRNPLWRLWLSWAARRPVRQGRVLFMGVLPARHGQGIGKRLLHQAMQTAHQQGWQSLTFGPLPGVAPAVGFLERHGAEARQSYVLYQGEL